MMKLIIYHIINGVREFRSVRTRLNKLSFIFSILIGLSIYSNGQTNKSFELTSKTRMYLGTIFLADNFYECYLVDFTFKNISDSNVKFVRLKDGWHKNFVMSTLYFLSQNKLIRDTLILKSIIAPGKTFRFSHIVLVLKDSLKFGHDSIILKYVIMPDLDYTFSLYSRYLYYFAHIDSQNQVILSILEGLK